MVSRFFYQTANLLHWIRGKPKTTLNPSKKSSQLAYAALLESAVIVFVCPDDLHQEGIMLWKHL